MEPIITNSDKQNNYRVQFSRLKKAMDNAFYLEAVFIEYAIIEDRADSILSYEGYTVKSRNPNGFVTFGAKKRKIEEISRDKKSLMHRYFSNDLMERLMEWVNERNGVIHALLKQNTTTEDLMDFAERGCALCKELRNKANNYKKMLERKCIAKKNDVKED